VRRKKHKFEEGRTQVGSLLTKEIYHKAKVQAVIEGRRVGALIDEAIEQYLVRVKQVKTASKGETNEKVYKNIDLDKNA